MQLPNFILFSSLCCVVSRFVALKDKRTESSYNVAGLFGLSFLTHFSGTFMYHLVRDIWCFVFFFQQQLGKSAIVVAVVVVDDVVVDVAVVGDQPSSE